MADINLVKSALASDPSLEPMSDAEAAAALSEPTLTPRPERVSYTALGSTWGPDRAAEFRKHLMGAGDLGGYVHDLLAGPGFDAGNERVGEVVGKLVASGLCTEAEARDSLYAMSYRAGGPVTTDEVTEARALLAREAAVDAFVGLVTAYLNEHSHPARSDPSLPLPTAAELAEHVEAGK